MILDKLLEKKDIYAYAVLRKKELSLCKKQIKNYEPKERARLYERYDAMQTELERLCNFILHNTLKSYTIRNWKKK